MDEYDGEYKIKFNVDYDLALGKTLPMHDVVIVARFVFNDNDKYVCAECANWLNKYFNTNLFLLLI